MARYIKEKNSLDCHIPFMISSIIGRLSETENHSIDCNSLAALEK